MRACLCWVVGDTYFVTAEKYQERDVSVLLEQMKENLVLR